MDYSDNLNEIKKHLKEINDFKKSLIDCCCKSKGNKFITEPNIILTEDDDLTFVEIREYLENNWVEIRSFLLLDYKEQSPKFIKEYTSFEEFVENLNNQYPYSKSDKGNQPRVKYIKNEFININNYLNDILTNLNISKTIPQELFDHLIFSYKTKEKHPNISATVLRTSLQLFLRTNENFEKSKDLKTEIGQFCGKYSGILKKDNITKDHLDLIRKIGNLAVHPEEGQSFSSEDLSLAIDIYKNLLTCYFGRKDKKEVLREDAREISKKYTRN